MKPLFSKVLFVAALLVRTAAYTASSQTTTLPDAHGAYFTGTPQGHLVMSWMEGDAQEEKSLLKVAVSEDQGRTFSPAVCVPATRGASTAHGECPPKVAFRADGTVVVMYRLSQPTEDNPHAGDVFFVTSKDNGKSWSHPRSVSGSPASSRGFFDLRMLKNGDVAAIWLEGKEHCDKDNRGSTLCFARTQGGDSFGPPTVVTKNVCQCCKTRLFVDGKGRLHLAFRYIFASKARDMAYVSSPDGGKTFSAPATISPDAWVLEGCPHVGPDVAETASGLQFSWFTKGGIYRASSGDGGKTFTPRTEVSTGQRPAHPQMASLADGSTVIVWDEAFQENGRWVTKIGVQQVLPRGERKTRYLSGAGDCTHPVLRTTGGKEILVAYTVEGEGKTSVTYQRLTLR